MNSLTSIEKWALFFGYANDKKNPKLLNDLIHSKEGIAKANNILTVINQDENLRQRLRAHLKFLMDLVSYMRAMKEEAIEAWRKAGFK